MGIINLLSAVKQAWQSGGGAPEINALGKGGSRVYSQRMAKFLGIGRSSREESKAALQISRAEARLHARTNPIAISAIDTNVLRVVGTGLALVATPHRETLGWTVEQAAEWKRQVQAEFSLWSDSKLCDYYGELDFYDLQCLVLRAMLESGDCFSLLPQEKATNNMPYGLRLQILEGDRVQSESYADETREHQGVRFDSKGRPIAYRILDEHPGNTFYADNKVGKWVNRLSKTGRWRVLHHYQKMRPEQVRGLPYLMPIVEMVRQLGDYTDAEIKAAIVSSFVTMVIKTPTGDPGTVLNGQGLEGEDDQADLYGEAAPEMGAGAVIGLLPGEDAAFNNPNRPNPNAEQFILGMLRQCGMALGIPYEVLIKQYHQSYSASKAALLDAWQRFRYMRVWLSRSFCQPVYETWLAEAVARGRIEAPGFFTDVRKRWAYTRAAWHGDSMGSINPKDEIAGYKEAINERLMTREQAEWLLFGTDFNQTLPQKEDEHKKLKGKGMLPNPSPGAAAPKTELQKAEDEPPVATN